jgi:diacylglycerol kinase family enzyme
VNPAAGPRRVRVAQRELARAERALAARGAEGTVRLTEGPGHAQELARAAVAARATLVCAWGGDGTVNEVARAVAGTGTALGIVPAGSGNGLARELGLPWDPVAALGVALGRRERVIDVGDVEGRLFVNLAGIGLDAHVAERFNARHRGRRGLWPYLAIGTREIFRYRARTYTLRVGGETWREEALAIVCANARQYGRAPTTATWTSSSWRRARRSRPCGTRSTCSAARWTGRRASGPRARRRWRSPDRSRSSSTWTGSR